MTLPGREINGFSREFEFSLNESVAHLTSVQLLTGKTLTPRKVIRFRYFFFFGKSETFCTAHWTPILEIVLLLKMYNKSSHTNDFRNNFDTFFCNFYCGNLESKCNAPRRISFVFQQRRTFD